MAGLKRCGFFCVVQAVYFPPAAIFKCMLKGYMQKMCALLKLLYSSIDVFVIVWLTRITYTDKNLDLMHIIVCTTTSIYTLFLIDT